MRWPDSESSGPEEADQPADQPPSPADAIAPPASELFSPRHASLGVNTDLIRLVAAAADLCRKPLRHGVVPLGDCADLPAESLEVCLRLEARSPEGERLGEQDLELEIYPSGSDLNLTLAWCQDEGRPMLWQGGHPVWMDAGGRRCPPPADGQPIEALARRLRALLVNG